jgi:hypothetical protein
VENLTPNEDGFPGLQEPFVPPTINLHIILDVSPSMVERWPQTLSGLNEYMYSLRKDQKDNNQDYQVTMTTFSDHVEKIYDRVVLDKLPTFSSQNLSPYGSGTALYRAIHETLTPINETGPVLVVIITDGEDNSSTRTDQDLADKLIADRQKLGNYTYAYLGVAKEAWGNTVRMARSANLFRGASSNNMDAAAYTAAVFDASSKGLAGSTLRYSRAMRSNAVRHAPQASMNVSKFFDDTPDETPESPATAISNAQGWESGK